MCRLEWKWMGLGTCFVLLLLFCFAGAAEQTEPEAKTAKVELQIAVSLNRPEPTLVLLATNHSDGDFVTTEFWTRRNALVVFGPDGKTSRLTVSMPPTRIVIGPGKTKRWNVGSGILGVMRCFKTPGLYRVQWKVNDIEAPEILLLVEEPEAEEPLTKETLEKKLKETIVSFVLTDEPVLKAFRFFGIMGEIPITVDEARIDADKTVTLKMERVSLEAALRKLTGDLGLKYVVRDKDVLITDEEGAKAGPPEK